MPPAPLSLTAANVAPRAKASNYPPEFAVRVLGRVKRPLGDLFGLNNFGVNLTTLKPGAQSALLHRHSRQDEFVYVLAGSAVLVTDQGEAVLNAGDCAGFAAGGVAHFLVNRSDADMVYLEIGDRSTGDESFYPEDDIVAKFRDGGGWVFTHKDGRAYP